MDETEMQNNNNNNDQVLSTEHQLSIVKCWFIKVRTIITSKLPSVVENTNNFLMRRTLKFYLISTLLLIGSLSYAVSASQSDDGIVTLSGYLTGMLTVFSSLGSLLAGIGTVGAVITALYVSGEWKEQKFLELFFPLATNLEDSLMELSLNISMLHFYIKLFSLGDFTDQHIADYEAVYLKSLENKKYLANIKVNLEKSAYLTKNNEKVNELVNLIAVLNYLITPHNITRLNITPLQQDNGNSVHQLIETTEITDKETIQSNAAFFEENAESATNKVRELSVSLSTYLKNHI
ncbi:hypothetical protein [Vibrio sp. EA2]|uniref:hypothetical protein n=1 Tax=Vibrio sp. EA2 TaxID=3079860 RepID=UPI0029496F4C|nr:hypothetical protein [Vibrio sp. EA2]MDV6252087.1 hypothetical protein [Vibrio sp. EA2]